MLEKAYFTAIQRCEQGISDALITDGVVLKEFCVDFPSTNEVFMKSNSSSFYIELQTGSPAQCLHDQRHCTT